MFFRTLLLILFFCNAAGPCCALKIVINRGEISKHPIAIVDFCNKNGVASKLGENICSVVRNDLKDSGLFVTLEQESFLENGAKLICAGHCQKNWSVIGATFLVYGSVQKNGEDFSIDFELWDVFSGAKMLAYKIKGKASNQRKIAHTIADSIYKRITNQDGYFNTNIVYVETSYNKKVSKRRTRLVQIDQDGFNAKQLTDGATGLVLTPRYSSDGRTIAYISYKDKAKTVVGKSANVYMLDLKSGKHSIMINEFLMKKLIKKNNGEPVQMTYAPRFSNDNRKAVLAIIIDGKSAIYSINFETNALVQLTEHSGIDTSPCYSNDGKKIVFTSNRGGKEAIYVMNADGSNPQKISNGSGKYSQPVWSPRGDLIAFSKQVRGEFYIGVMNTDGTGERLIVQGYLVEAPCWASNGRYITYSTESSSASKSKIGIVDITGQHNRILKTEKDGSYPAWSPAVLLDSFPKNR